MTLRIFLYIFAIAISPNVFSEYIIFEKGKDAIHKVVHKKSSPGRYEFVFETLLKFQWPMNIANFNNIKKEWAAAGKTKGQILGEMVAYTGGGEPLEFKYIQKQLQSKYPELDIAFISTFTYELFCILNKSKLNSLNNQITGIVSWGKGASPAQFDAPLRSILASPTGTIEQVLEMYNNVNKLPVVRDSHQTINNELIDYIRSLDFYKASTKKSDLGAIIEENKSALTQDILNKLSATGISILGFNLKSAYDRILNFEYESYKKNFAILYRGGADLVEFFIPEKGSNIPIEFTYFLKNFDSYKPITKAEEAEYSKLVPLAKAGTLDAAQAIQFKALQEKMDPATLFKWDEPLRSISYGNSIFAGYYEDPGACSYNFMAKPTTVPGLIFKGSIKDTIGYALKINKWLYASEKLQELFVISPFCTLVAIFASGEFFHSRSKSYYFKQALKTPVVGTPSVKVIGILGGPITDNRGYVVKEGNPIEAGAQLSKYIAENAIMIKLFGFQGIGGNGFDFKDDSLIVKNYKNQQRNVTVTFQAMARIYGAFGKPAIQRLKKHRPKVLNNFHGQIQGLSQRAKSFKWGS